MVKVLLGYVDVIMIWIYEYEKVEEFVKEVDILVINGFMDKYYLCQVLVDFLMIKEMKGKFKGVKVVYIGDGNNVVYLLMIGCVKMGCEILIVFLKGYEVLDEVVEVVKIFVF